MGGWGVGREAEKTASPPLGVVILQMINAGHALVLTDSSIFRDPEKKAESFADQLVAGA